MSTRSIRLPDIGEGVTEAEITEWQVKVGERVAEDQTLGSVMTDKATVEIPSPVAGTVEALGGEIGDVLAVGAELARIAPDEAHAGEEAGAEPDAGREMRSGSGRDAGSATAGDGAGHDTDTATQRGAVPTADGGARPETRSDGPARVRTDAEPDETALGDRERDADGSAATATARRPPPASTPLDKPLAAPAVRRHAHELGLDLTRVRGTGPKGRITHEDLERQAALDAGREPATPPPRDRVDEIRVVGMRRQIARAMQRAKRRIPHFGYVEEVDVTALEELRSHLNARHRETHPRLTVLPFIVMAVVRSLAAFPQMNARYDDESNIVRRHSGRHVGLATQTDGGLVVPVIRHAERLGLRALAAEMNRLAETARSGRIAPDELAGGTITVTSLGALGGLVSTPVINYPEVAIVGVNRVALRPACRDGRIVPRQLMNLSSSFDHRVVDGHEAAEFVQCVRAYLEHPATLFIDD